MSTDVVLRENVTPYLRVVGDRLRDLAPVLAPLVDEVREYFVEQFETSGAAGGQPWAPLSLATVLGKAKRGASPKTLEDSLALMDSLELGGGYGYVDLGRDHVRVGTSDPVAAILSAGTSRMPARDIVGDPGERRVERWADVLAERLLR